jgi:hypothetical protein
LGGTLTLALSIIDDYSIEGKQVSEETSSADSWRECKQTPSCCSEVPAAPGKSAKGVSRALKKDTVATSFISVCQQLSCDHHPKIAFAAVRTDSLIKCTLFGLLSDAEERKDLARIAEAAVAEVLAKTISENDPASPRCQAALRDHTRKDGLYTAVTGFTSGILAPTNRSWHRSRQDFRGSRIDP